MERINLILNHPRYVDYINRIKIHEEERIFCKHDMVHFLDVCRIAENLWLNYCISSDEFDNMWHISSKTMREYIYAVGLLHDIGRWQEYEEDIRHEVASKELAKSILEEIINFITLCFYY